MIGVGINGFGRTGRQVLRALLAFHPDIRVVVINDLGDPSLGAHLFQHDSTYGTYPSEVNLVGDRLHIGGSEIQMMRVPDPAVVPWGHQGVEIVIEATGHFNESPSLRAHLYGGAARIVVCAPSDEADVTLIYGINEGDFDAKRHYVISGSSCTTNALAPIASVLHRKFGIEVGFISTIHSFTNSQRLLDKARSGFRDSRAAPSNIVPAPTGAATSLGLVIPDLAGRILGMAFRVPTMSVSALDFTVQLSNDRAGEINQELAAAAQSDLRTILGYTDRALVSADFRGSPLSATVSGVDTLAHRDFAKVVAWYDHEYGYSCRIADLVSFLAHAAPHTRS